MGLKFKLPRWRWPLVWRKDHEQAVVQERENARMARTALEAEFRERERVAQEIVGRFAGVRVTFDNGSYQISTRFSPEAFSWGNRRDQDYIVDLMIRNIEREIKRSVFVRPPERIGDSYGWRMGAGRPQGPF